MSSGCCVRAICRVEKMSNFVCSSHCGVLWVGGYCSVARPTELDKRKLVYELLHPKP